MPPTAESEGTASTSLSQENATVDQSQQTQTTATPDANVTANPSNAGETDANKPTNLLDAVRKAVTPDSKVADSSTTKTQEGTEEAPVDPKLSGQDAGKEKVDGTSEGDKNLPFHNHPRWKEVIAERDSYKPDAEQYRMISSYMEQHALTPKEVSEGFIIMAALKHNPAEALKMLQPHLESARTFVGEILPADLSKQVEDGHITKESASELARRRNESGLYQQREQVTNQQLQQREQARLQQEALATSQSISQSVTDWEKGIQTRDPDYARLQPMVLDRAIALNQQTPPRNAQEAVKLAEQAYKEVKERARSFAPQRQQVRVQTSQNSSAGNKAAPSSLLEAVRQAAGSQ